MVPIGGGSSKSVLSDRWIVYTKSRKQFLHQKYLLYETGCMFKIKYAVLNMASCLLIVWSYDKNILKNQILGKILKKFANDL